MKATDEEIKAGRELWGDVWNFWKANYHAEPSEEFWHHICDEADKLCKKYDGNTFVSKLISACVIDIESRGA